MIDEQAQVIVAGLISILVKELPQLAKEKGRRKKIPLVTKK